MAPLPGGVKLCWQPVQEDLLGNPIVPDAYRIFRWTSSPDSMELVAEVPPTETCFIDNGEPMGGGSPVFYHVTAILN